MIFILKSGRKAASRRTPVLGMTAFALSLSNPSSGEKESARPGVPVGRFV
jgi:hypothetical protein